MSTGPGVCSYTLAAGTPNPPSFTSAGGSGTATVTAETGCAWTATSSSPSWLATTSAGSGNGTANYTVSANTSANSRTGTIAVGGRVINVTQAGTSPPPCSYTLAAGTPNPPSFNSAGGSGTATVTVETGCSWTATSSSPSWLATTSAGSGNGTANYTVSANTSANSRTGTIAVGGRTINVTQAGGTAVLPPSAPVISAGGIVNTASYAPGGPPNGSLAKGSFFSIYGSNLGPDAPVKATSYPLPSTLGGASIQITQGSNRYSAPLVFVYKNQINAILPSNVPAGKAQVSITYNGVTGQPADITVATTSFGVFFQRVNGTDLAIAQNQDYRLNLPDTPAKPGQIVIFWGTGLGPITGADNTAPGPTGDMTGVQVTITVGGVTARRMFAGRQSETAAVDNIYFTVPTGVPYGCRVPVAITAGGVAANTTNIAITADGSSCAAPPVGACVNIAGQWRGNEKGTLTCTVTVNGESVTETDPISGSDIVTVSQQGCQASYTSKSMMEAFGAGQALRKGQVEGTNVKFSGIMGEPAPGFSAVTNLFEASGAVENNVINLTGSGTFIGSGVLDGVNMKFSCTVTTKATLTKCDGSYCPLL